MNWVVINICNLHLIIVRLTISQSTLLIYCHRSCMIDSIPTNRHDVINAVTAQVIKVHLIIRPWISEEKMLLCSYHIYILNVLLLLQPFKTQWLSKRHILCLKRADIKLAQTLYFHIHILDVYILLYLKNIMIIISLNKETNTGYYNIPDCIRNGPCYWLRWLRECPWMFPLP